MHAEDGEGTLTAHSHGAVGRNGYEAEPANKAGANRHHTIHCLQKTMISGVKKHSDAKE